VPWDAREGISADSRPSIAAAPFGTARCRRALQRCHARRSPSNMRSRFAHNGVGISSHRVLGRLVVAAESVQGSPLLLEAASRTRLGGLLVHS
jgi:hypothetical protein